MKATVSKDYKFNAEQLGWFNDYEEVRANGSHNMFSPEARMLTGLSRDEYHFVMSNYSELKEFINSK